MPFTITSQGTGTDQSVVLRNATGTCEAELFCFGGLLNAFHLRTAAGTWNVVDGFTSPREARQQITHGFKSAKLSPFTCRMNRGSYRFMNQDYRVEKFYMGPHAIHGIIYDAVYELRSIHAEETSAAAVFHYRYPGSDKGYPFPYETTIEWTLQPHHQLTATTTVVHHHPTPIPFAEGWHPYFTLGKPLDECTLQLDAAALLEFDDTLLPTGKLLPDNRFTLAAPLKGVQLDNCFVLNARAHQPACILQTAGIRLSILPDAAYPYLQVYTPPHRHSIAIENLSGAPDAFNNGIGLTLLAAGEPAVFSTTYQLDVVP